MARSPEYAGERQRRRSQSTGTIVVVMDAREQGLDEDGGRWYVECVDHGEAICFETLAEARWHAPHPEGWCMACSEENV